VESRGIHHVGVAVEDLDEALQTYERLFGGTLEHRSRVEEQGVDAASVRVGESRVEPMRWPTFVSPWRVSPTPGPS
jgi:methylmalonyl-CoA/ethylmalonyl-CoA epimerase